MARAIFLGLPLHGHTNPALPLVRALVESGDEVVWYSAGPFADRIAHAGAAFRPYRNRFLTDLSHVSERTHELAWLMMQTTAEVLEGEFASMKDERPDYVITDSLAPWGQWVGQLLRRPVVTSISTFAMNRHVMAFGASVGSRPKSVGAAVSKIRHLARAARLRRRLRRTYGVQGTGIVGLLFGQSGLNIVYTSRYVQPRAETFDGTFHFIGPSVSSRMEQQSEAMPDGVPSGDGHTAPLVYVSLGTLFNADASFYRTCFDAFGGTTLRVVMAIGRSLDPASLGATPPNVLVRPYVAQLDVLQRASAFVSHGGMNSVSESLHYGVPMVLVPQMAEQAIVAARVEQLGAGVRLRKEAVTAAALRDAVSRVLDNERFRQGAAAVQRSFRESGGVPEAVAAIRAYTVAARPA